MTKLFTERKLLSILLTLLFFLNTLTSLTALNFHEGKLAICTAYGLGYVDLKGGAPTSQKHPGQHCILCKSGNDDYALVTDFEFVKLRPSRFLHYVAGEEFHFDRQFRVAYIETRAPPAA